MTGREKRGTRGLQVGCESLKLTLMLSNAWTLMRIGWGGVTDSI